MNTLIIELKLESAKLRARVPYVPACPRASRARVPACLDEKSACPRARVPACLRAFVLNPRARVPACPRARVP